MIQDIDSQTMIDVKRVRLAGSIGQSRDVEDKQWLILMTFDGRGRKTDGLDCR